MESAKPSAGGHFSQYYRVLSDLFTGREGTVIKKALHIATETIVVLKVTHIRDESRRARCRREAELLASVNHRHIVKFYASYESQSEFVLVTEYCPGGDLLDRVSRTGPLHEAKAREYLLQLLGAFQYLATCGVAHRDIKLDNIFIGDGDMIKLGDFGFATRFSPGERFQDLCGTPGYAAPELLLIDQCYEPLPADVYSLGITLYAMCVGCLPYDTLEGIATGRRISSLAVPSSFSPALCDLLCGMLSASPKDRPSLSQVQHSEWVVAQLPRTARCEERAVAQSKQWMP